MIPQNLDGWTPSQTPQSDGLFSQTFKFEEIAELDNQALQLLLQKIQAADLVIALLEMSEGAKDKIYNNMLPDDVRMFAENIATKSPVHLEIRQAAQERVLAILKQLKRDGKITLPERGDILDE